MSLRLQVVLLDLGNTLIYDDPDAWPDVYRRAEAALWNELRGLGVTCSADVLYDHHASLLHYYYALHRFDLAEPGMGTVLQTLLARQNIAIPAGSLQAALRMMYAVAQTNWHAEGDALPTLMALRENGLRVAVVSNGADHMNARELVQQAGLTPYLELILSSAAFGWRKPHAGIFRAALDHFGVGPDQAAMVGDSYEADVLGAHAIGLHTAWVTRRVRNPPARIPIEPDFRVARLSELPGLLI